MEGTKGTPLVRTPSLYERLGGQPMVTRVVDDYVVNVLVATDISAEEKKPFREGDITALKNKLVTQITTLTAAPPPSTGATAKAHVAGVQFTDSQRKAFQKALESNHLSAALRDELLTRLAPGRSPPVNQ